MVWNDSDDPPPDIKPADPGYRYALFLGSLNPRKNLIGVVRAFEVLRESGFTDLRLVVAGASKSIFASRAGLSPAIKESVTVLEYVDEQEKWSYLKGAELLIMLSFLEGFGLPVLEALKVGTPVLASDIPVFRELFEDSVVYVDPHSPQEAARAIRVLATDPRRREQLVRRGREVSRKFSWTTTALQYVRIIEGTIAS